MPRKATLPSPPSAPPTRAAGPARRVATTPAVIYLRVSSKDQEKEGFSIPAQQKLLQAYAAEHGYQVLAEFVDIETAKKAGRTQFGKMTAYLKQNPSCRHVLVEKTDRLYRNFKDYVELDELDLVIHLVKENQILSSDSRSNEKFIHGIRVLMAKNFIDNLREETTKGMREKAEQGIYPSRAPIGYRNVRRSDGRSVIELDPHAAPLVTKLYELYAEGTWSLQRITHWARHAGLRREGAVTPLGQSSIHRILVNPFYTGEFTWNGVTRRGSHAALVSRELFDRVDAVLNNRGTSSRHPFKHDFLLSGLVLCGDCHAEGRQRHLVADIKKGRYIYYHCEHCRRERRTSYIREEVIEEAIRTAMRAVQLTGDELALVRESVLSGRREMARLREAAVRRLQDEHERLQRRILVAYDDRVEGRIDVDIYEAKVAEWREAQARIRRDIDAHQVADEATLRAGLTLLELAGRALELYDRQEPAQKRRLLELLYSNFIFDARGLRATWHENMVLFAESIDRAKRANASEPGSRGVSEGWYPQ